MSAAFMLLAPISLACVAVAAQSDKVTVTLKLDPILLTQAKEDEQNLSYLPDPVDLTSQKPASVKKEPPVDGTASYGVIRLGNGPLAVHAFRIDSDPGKTPVLHVDLDGDGDLTNDAPCLWTKVGSDYSGAFVFRISYGTAAKETSYGQYGLNLSWNPGKTWMSYHRSSARVGRATLDGKPYDITVVENDNDGVFAKSFGDGHRPVWIIADGATADARGSFGIGDTNYKAQLSSDGSKLTLEATAEAVTDTSKGAGSKKPGVGDLAPDFIALSGDGELRLSDLRGKVVVLDLWATWCGPCKASLPHVQEVSERYKDKGVQVLGLNVYDARPAYDEWVASNKQFSFMFAYDGGGRDHGSSIAGSKYGVDAIPTSFVIDREGRITAEVVGFMGPDDHRLEQAINKALGTRAN